MEACVTLGVRECRREQGCPVLLWNDQSCGSSPAEKPETSAGLQYTLQHQILVITGSRGRIYIHFFKADTLKLSKHEQCVYAVSGLLLHSFIYFASQSLSSIQRLEGELKISIFCVVCHGVLVHPLLLFAHNGKRNSSAVLMSPLIQETFQKIVKIQYLRFFYCLLTS